MTLREESLSCAYAAVRNRIPMVSETQFNKTFDGWEIFPVYSYGMVIGAVLKNGCELHIAVHPDHQKRHYLRHIFRLFMNSAIEEYGMVCTRVESSHSIGHRLARILGFKETGKKGSMVEYECKEVKL